MFKGSGIYLTLGGIVSFLNVFVWRLLLGLPAIPEYVFVIELIFGFFLAWWYEIAKGQAEREREHQEKLHQELAESRAEIWKCVRDLTECCEEIVAEAADGRRKPAA